MFCIGTFFIRVVGSFFLLKGDRAVQVGEM